MRSSVSSAYCKFTDKFEGNLTCMYLDEGEVTSFNPQGIGLVTTGRGSLIDPVTSALRLPWKQAVGAGPNFSALATPDQVTAEWTKVKSLQSMRKQGGGAFYKVTSLRLAPADVDADTMARVSGMWNALLRRFPNIDQACADAQLGVLSMAWAMGSGFVFPKFQAAFLAGDFHTCAQECTIQGNHAARNAANVTLFTNAWQVSARGLDPDKLYYPTDLLQGLVAD